MPRQTKPPVTSGPRTAGHACRALLDYLGYLSAVLWIRIRIGSVFRNFVDPDPYSRYGLGSTHLNVG